MYRFRKNMLKRIMIKRKIKIEPIAPHNYIYLKACQIWWVKQKCIKLKRNICVPVSLVDFSIFWLYYVLYIGNFSKFAGNLETLPNGKALLKILLQYSKLCLVLNEVFSKFVQEFFDFLKFHSKIYFLMKNGDYLLY